MSNDFFDSGDYTALNKNTLARASGPNAVFQAMEAAFDKLPGKAAIDQGTITAGTDSGEANIYVVTTGRSHSSYTDLMEVWFQAGAANTGSSTVDVDTVGAASIRRQSGDALEGGDIPAGAIVGLRYDLANTHFKMITPVADATAAAASASAASASASAASSSAAAASSSASAASASASAASSSASEAQAAVGGVKVSSDDTAAGDLETKLLVASGLSLATQNGGGNETRTISLHANLSSIAGLTSAADKVPYYTGSGTAALADFTSFGRSLTGGANAAAARATLGLGTMAVESVAAVPAMTFAATQNFADNSAQRAKLLDYSEAVNDLGALGGGTVDLDFESGNVVIGTVTSSTTTITVSNPPASGAEGSMTIKLFGAGTQTINWPSNVEWPGGNAPTLTDNTFTFTTDYATDDKLDATSHPLKNGDRVQLTTSGTLPAGLAADTQYFVVNAGANDFELSATLGGAAVDVTDNGSGTHTLHWGKDAIVLITNDGGATYSGFAAGLDMQVP